MFHVSYTHQSYIINEIWRFKALILGSCTYNTRLFPHMESLITMLNNKQIKDRYIGYFGSYTWSGGAFKMLEQFAENSNLSSIGPAIEVKSHPTNEDIEQCAELGKNMAQTLRQS